MPRGSWDLRSEGPPAGLSAAGYPERLMRRFLLWCASNPWMRANMPRLWFVRASVRRFMPGETLAAAVGAAERFRVDAIGTLFTRLGENLTELSEADKVAEHYVGVLDEIAARGLDAEISVKPTQLGLDIDSEATFVHCDRLCAHAAGLPGGGTVWIDMESSVYVDETLGLYVRLRERHPNVGICLQAYLHRTTADIERLLPLGPSVRLVKGAYSEPPSVAAQSRADVDANYLAHAVALIVKGHATGTRVGLGTHDVALIKRIAGEAATAGIGRDAFEVQMLYGIREDELRRLRENGHVVRSLIAYGTHWYPWYLRRLAERPANILFVARQFVPRLRPQRAGSGNRGGGSSASG